MHRFFLPPALFSAFELVFPPDTARQIRSVLRLHAGQQVVCLDNLGSEYRVELAQVEAGEVRGVVIERRRAAGEPQTRLSLYLGLTQREKFEWMLQKCTEVGAAAFIPVICERSLVQDGRDADRKSERWQRILQEAAEQCGRGRVPELHPALKFGAAAAQAARESDLALIPWEGENSLGLRAALASASGNSPMRISLMIGPEGGFAEGEVEAARNAGLKPVTLGPRILRMETAAVVAATLVLHELGEMG